MIWGEQGWRKRKGWRGVETGSWRWGSRGRWETGTAFEEWKAVVDVDGSGRLGEEIGWLVCTGSYGEGEIIHEDEKRISKAEDGGGKGKDVNLMKRVL